MSNANPYQSFDAGSVAGAGDSVRVEFIRRTYAHLAGAVLLFVLIECIAFMLTDVAQREAIVRLTMGGRWSWLIVLGAFIGVSWIANNWANSTTSLSSQYLGLGTYVVAEAAIFMPLLFLADMAAPGAITTAAMMTAVVFGCLTAFIFATRTDLAGWGKYLALSGMGLLGYIVLAIIFPQSLGLGSVFSAIMIVFACGYILYDTSNVMHHYQPSQYVAAALALFASVALLFWYILRLVMSFGRE